MNHYEYALDGNHKTRVLVREIDRRAQGARGRHQQQWKCYMVCNCEAQARHILQMLEQAQADEMSCERMPHADIR